MATGYSAKLQWTYKGPLVVIGTDLSDTYRLKKLNEIRVRNDQTTAHVRQLKLWKNSNCEQESEEENDSDAESNVDNNLAQNIQTEDLHGKNAEVESEKNSNNKNENLTCSVIRPNQLWKKLVYLNDYEF